MRQAGFIYNAVNGAEGRSHAACVTRNCNLSHGGGNRIRTRSNGVEAACVTSGPRIRLKYVKGNKDRRTERKKERNKVGKFMDNFKFGLVIAFNTLTHNS
jgi:hypothetical protein